MANSAKERFIEALRELKRQGKPIVYQEELEWAREAVALFKCPIHFHPTFCDWKPCPDEKSEANCREIRKALWLIYKVEHGMVKVHYRDVAVRML